MKTSELLRSVRMVGRFGWLGGYTHALLMDDGETIGPECVAPNYRQISTSTRHADRDGWQCVAVYALVDPDENTYCANCNKVLV